MTVVKQVAVTSAAHFGNVARYLDSDRAIMRDSRNIASPERWKEEMAETRAAYGHDVPSRAGAANTLMYHQVLAFLPEEAEMSGGPVTAQVAMDYARDYVQTRYPDQEAVWVLHKEHCVADGTDRYAVHIAINRTNLSTGNRLAEGRSKQAKVSRENTVRDLDRKWGLTQVRANERNSRVHARQPTRAEKEMAARGARSDKQYIRDAVRQSVREASLKGGGAREFAAALSKKGVSVSVSKTGRDLTFERASTGLRVNGAKLGRGFSGRSIARAVGLESARAFGRINDETLGYER